MFFLFFELARLRCTFNAFSTTKRRKCCKSIWFFFRSKIPLFYYYVTVSLSHGSLALNSSKTCIQFKYKRHHHISLCFPCLHDLQFSPKSKATDMIIFLCLETFSNAVIKHNYLHQPSSALHNRRTQTHNSVSASVMWDPGEQQRRAVAPPLHPLCFCHE